MESKSENNSNLSIEGLLRQKIVELESEVVEKNNEIVELKKKLTKVATMESKIENIANLSLEQLPQQKIVVLESEVVEKNNEIVELKKKLTKVITAATAMERKIENITEFPNEILLKIFGFLSTKDVLRNVAQVSKRFNQLTQDQFLIRKIEVDTSSWCKKTKSWELTEQEEEKYCNDLVEVCKRSQKLKFFSLKFFSQEIGTKIFEALPLMNHENLEELCLKSSFIFGSFASRAAENAVKYLSQCSKLKKLKIEICYFGNNQFLKNLFNNFEHENLEELHLIGCNVYLEKSAFKKSLEKIVGNLPKLKYLNLGLYYSRENRSEYEEICREIASEKKIKIETKF